MNKLEELKALLAEEERCAERWILAANTESNDGSIKPDWVNFRNAKASRNSLVTYLLPHLIAVAEVAKKIDWPNACLKNYEERILVNVLQDALLPLTKDADK